MFSFACAAYIYYNVFTSLGLEDISTVYCATMVTAMCEIPIKQQSNKPYLFKGKEKEA